MLDAGRYKANFTRGGLMVPESRVVAGLLLKGVDADGWRQAIQVENVLAKRSVSTAAAAGSLTRTGSRRLRRSRISWGVGRLARRRMWSMR
jgi:hypothetical protein